MKCQKKAVGLLCLLLFFGVSPAAAAGLETRSSEYVPLSLDVPYRRCFELAADRYALSPRLLVAIARVESAFDARAVSHKDAVGIMQIRWPLTARHLGIDDRVLLYNPCLNIEAGARYLRELIDRFATLEQALASYNMGPSRISVDAEQDLPAAGRRYVTLVREAHASMAVPSERRGEAGKAPGQAMVLELETRERATAMQEVLQSRAPRLDVSVVNSGDRWLVRIERRDGMRSNGPFRDDPW